MDRNNFNNLFSKTSLSGSRIETNVPFADHIFRLFDHNHDGYVSFMELMTTFSDTTRGTLKERMSWIFDVYDVDSNGVVTLQELCEVMKCMQRVRMSIGRGGGGGMGEYVYEETLEEVFGAADGNHDGLLTLDEFIGATESLPELITVLTL